MAFVPGRLMAALPMEPPLRTVTPPIDPGIDEQFMFYPAPAQNDPASSWLRGIVAEIGRSLDRPGRSAA